MGKSTNYSEPTKKLNFIEYIMDQAEQTLRAYENDLNAEKTIRDTVTKAYGDLKPELQQIQDYENQQFPTFYDRLNSGYGMGTGAADMSPTARLGTAWGDVGRLSSTANVARGIFDVRRAGMEDLIGTALNQWNTGYGMAQNAWDRQYKMRSLGGGGGTPSIKWPEMPKQPNQDDIIQRAYADWIKDQIAGGATSVLPEQPSWMKKTGYAGTMTPFTNSLGTTDKNAGVFSPFTNPFGL